MRFDHGPSSSIRHLGTRKSVRAVRRPLEPPGRAAVSPVARHSRRQQMARRRMRNWRACVRRSSTSARRRRSPASSRPKDFSRPRRKTLRAGRCFSRAARRRFRSRIPPSMWWSQGLVLNFVPDQRAGLVEMARVAVKGGTIAAYVWDYAGKMELMRYFWDAAVQLNPDAAKMDEGVRFPQCHPQALEELFRDAGLNRSRGERPSTYPRHLRISMTTGSPSSAARGRRRPMPCRSTNQSRARLRDRIRERLPVAADGSISLIARAWAVRATVPK